VGIRGMAQRLSWGLADQAVSSLTNFAVGVFVAHGLGITAFGIFSLAWVTYGVILNISRGLATDPLVVRFSGVRHESWRDGVGRSAGTALAVGIGTGLLSVVIGIAFGGDLGWAFVALGIVLPALTLQDAWRFAFFAAGVGQRAFANDLVWAVAMIPAMWLAHRDGSVVGFLLAWGLSAGVAAIYGCVQTGMLPRLTGVRSWLRETRDLGTRYMVENVSNSGSTQLRMYGLGAIAGVAAVGSVRGAELLMGPFLAVLMGLSFVAVPEAARVLRRNHLKLPRFCLYLGGVQSGGTLLWGLALLLLVDDRIGTFVLGETWYAAAPLIIPATLSIANAGFINGAAAGLRALGDARRSLRCMLIMSTAYVVFGLAGAFIDGAAGSAWGAAAATSLGAIVWWTQLHVSLRLYTPAPAADELALTGEESRTP
jgi:O-antigen/teichoic acid export membrane protein